MKYKDAPNRKELIKKAMLLVWIGELWNIVEAVLALRAGAASGSVSLLAFGLKSIIELFLGGVLIWQLQRELKAVDGESINERRTLKFVGYSFFGLALYVLIQSGATLVGWIKEPEPSLIGIFVVLASAAIMALLYLAKINLARKLGSRSLQKEARATLACDLQDMTVIVGLVLNSLFGWWWADPVTALFLVPFLINEGREALEESQE